MRAPGDQTDPSISGEWVVFASSVSGDWDVRSSLIGSSPGTTPVLLAGGPGDQDQPDLHGTVLAYRAPEGVFVQSWTDHQTLAPIRSPGQPGAACGRFASESQPTVGERVAAWECGEAGSRSVAVLTHQDGAPEYSVPPPPGAGEQFAPAAFGSLVAFLHGSAGGGSVWLHDSASQGTVPVCGGTATGVAVGQSGGRTVVATTRRSARADADVEVWEPSLLVTALAIPGEQRNPHLSADWIAFEDLSTGSSQVVLWQWTTGLVFLPHPSTTEQTLNDLDTTAGVEVRAVFAEEVEGSATGVDISRYRIALGPDGNVFDDGTGNPWPWGPVPPPSGRPPPVGCDDPDPVVLGTLTVTRARGTPRADAVDFPTTPWSGDPALPVLVCIEANGITAGWMTLDDEAIAWPRDFGHDRVKVAIPAVARDATARLAAVVGGKPGSSLVVRVLADPGRPPPDCGGGDGEDGSEVVQVDSGRAWDHDRDGDHDQGFGNSGWLHVADDRFDRRLCGSPGVPQPQAIRRCSSGGPAGALALFALLLAAHLKRRR